MNREQLKDMLALHEGKRLAAYKDTVGVLTIGIGHNCRESPVAGVEKAGDRITELQCNHLFASDIANVVSDLDHHLPWWQHLDEVRQNVLADMCFNMGITTLKTFRNTLGMMKRGDYEGASEGMLASLWATQVGQRAERLAEMMRTGEWPQDV